VWGGSGAAREVLEYFIPRDDAEKRCRYLCWSRNSIPWCPPVVCATERHKSEDREEEEQDLFVCSRFHVQCKHSVCARRSALSSKHSSDMSFVREQVGEGHTHLLIITSFVMIDWCVSVREIHWCVTSLDGSLACR